MSLCTLGVSEAATDIREGRTTSVELVSDCLKRIEEVDPQVQAWTFLDRDHALRQAEASGPRPPTCIANTAGRSARCMACRSA
jgi:Asp-tRNA(Asn)/Glu-tRNA(Gln) amidotransferase A subunit family amidase